MRSDESDRWETKQHILLPNIVYHKLSKPPTEKTILERKRKIDSVDCEAASNWDIASLHRCDLPMLPIQLKRILCRDNCAMVPLTENQMGFFREVDSLEDFWRVEHDPASPSPQVSPEVPVCTTEDKETKDGDDLTVSPQIVTPDTTRTAALEPPPAKKAKQQEKNF